MDGKDHQKTTVGVDGSADTHTIITLVGGHVGPSPVGGLPPRLRLPSAPCNGAVATRPATVRGPDDRGLAAVTATSALSLGLRVALLRRTPARDVGDQVPARVEVSSGVRLTCAVAMPARSGRWPAR